MHHRPRSAEGSSWLADQNWFAVGLDVVVVITGIFLGMQVSGWEEEREDR